MLLIAWMTTAFVAGAAVSARWYADDEAERVLATLVVAHVILFYVVHVLGWSGALYPWAVSTLMAGVSVVLVVVSLGRRGARARVWPAVRGAWSACLLPVRWALEATRRRHIAALGLLSVVGIWMWTLALVWLAPSNGWDAQVYMEPMAYQAVSRHGFEWLDVPDVPAVTQINTAPKGAMYLAMLAVMSSGKTWVEGTAHLHFVEMIVAFVVVARRFGVRELDAVAWASGLCLIPAFLFQLRSAYVDASFGALYVLALAWLTAPKMRAVDALLGALVLGILAGAKHTALVVVPLLAVGFIVRVLAGHLRAPRRWALVFACATLVLSVQLPTYARNWVHTDNPIYPRKISIAGMSFPGSYDPYHIKGVGAGRVWKPPIEGKQFYDTRDNGYGNVAPFVLPPLMLVALVWVLCRALARREREAYLLIAASAPALSALALTPGPFWARYNVAALAVGVLLCAWLLRGKARELGHALAAVMIVGNLVTLHWSEPVWCVPPRLAWELFREDAAERAVTETPLPLMLTGEAGRARAREVGAGDVVAYTFARFPARMWNDAVTNLVERVVFSRDYLKRLDEVDATWVFVRPESAADRLLAQTPGWERVADEPSNTRPERIYRRVPVALAQ